jgi:membrane-associated phospholipid phosphatase
VRHAGVAVHRSGACDGILALMPTGETRKLARMFRHVSIAIVTAPARWHPWQWALFLAVAATTLITYLEKWPLQVFIQRGGGSVVRAFALAVSAYVGGFAVLLLGVAMLVIGRWTRRRALVDAALALGAAGFWCWIFTRAGQLVLAERRPKEGGAMILFALGGHGVSGHASAAGLLLSPVRDVLARAATPRARRALTAALLGWAAFVGWSRVWLGMHFVWNVVLGLAIGFFTGFVATRALRG